MNQHIDISFDVDNEQPGIINNFKVLNNNCRIPDSSLNAVIDMLKAATTVNEAPLSNSTQGLSDPELSITSSDRGIVMAAGSNITDIPIVNMCCDIITMNIPSGTTFWVKPEIISSSLSDTAQLFEAYAERNRFVYKNIVPSEFVDSNTQYGLYALSMLDALCKYKYRELLIIWDENTTDVPYFFGPAIDMYLELYVYSTKQYRWLTQAELGSVIDSYKDKVRKCIQIKIKEQQ